MEPDLEMLSPIGVVPMLLYSTIILSGKNTLTEVLDSSALLH